MQQDTSATGSSFSLNFRAFVKLWPYLWPKKLVSAKLRLVIAFISLIAGKVAIMYIPLLFKKLIDTLPQPDLYIVPVSLIALYASTRFLSGFFADFRDGVFAVVTERAIREAALRVFTHMHQLSLKFHLERKTGGLSQTISRGIKSIEEFMMFSTFMLLPTLLEVVFVVSVFFFLYGGKVALTCFIALTLYMFATIKITEWRIGYIKHMNDSDSAASQKAIDSLLNFETVKYFNNEQAEIRRYDHVLQAYEKAAVKSKLTLAVLNSTQNFITSGALFLILIFTVQRYQAGTLTLGDVIAVNAYLLQLYNPLYTVGFSYRQVRLSLLNMDQMFTLLDVEKDVQDMPDAPALQYKSGEIVFDKVKFSYQKQREILKGVSFKVAPRSTLAIVGLSGAGKSTISKLLYRFYDVSSGQILIDGQDISKTTQQSLRKLIGVVPQDTVLFNDTIGYNIQYGNMDATFADVVEAAKKAQIHEFIESLPDKYDTMVGERGLKLSGGEKQRIAIARTLLKNPRIFLFDEATSSLDTNTEKKIQKQLEELSRDHTTIIIAHRLSTIVHADHIIVMDKGKIAEEGTHKQLLKANGIYNDLWQKQAKGENV